MYLTVGGWGGSPKAGNVSFLALIFYSRPSFFPHLWITRETLLHENICTMNFISHGLSALTSVPQSDTYKSYCSMLVPTEPEHIDYVANIKEANDAMRGKLLTTWKLKMTLTFNCRPPAFCCQFFGNYQSFVVLKATVAIISGLLWWAALSRPTPFKMSRRRNNWQYLYICDNFLWGHCQSPKNLVCRYALHTGKFLRVWKVFARI